MPTACHLRHAVRFHPTPVALALAAALLSMQALAAPTGGQVTAGTASIQHNGAVTDIHQASQKAAINWQGFGIAPNETVNFHQPNASAITLNRVVGNEASLIQGALNANGRVFLVNANGILFTQGASVNTAGLVASTLNITDHDFLSGNFVFQGDGSGKGSILNLGTIKATDGGYVALLGDQVRNQGVIVAQLGTVALSSGKRITLNFNGDSLLKVSLDEGTLNALVENGQAIRADGGKVILTAKAANGLLDAQVNNTGIVQARTIGDLKGDIHVYAHGGTANIAGTLDASAPDGGDGGFIETSGERVKVADSVHITTRAANGKTGTWLIDPTDYTIGQGGDMTGATLSAQLENNDVKIESVKGTTEGNGDIHVNDAISWSSDNSLTLDAVRDININNAITISGANAGLMLKYGGDYRIRTKASYSGAVLDATGKPVAKQDTSGGVYGSVTFTNAATKSVYTAATPEKKEEITGLIVNGVAYTLIHSMEQLDALDGRNAVDRTGIAITVSGHYALAKDLDASGTIYTDALLGTSSEGSFSGTLTGLGHTVNNLTISAPSDDQQFTGLIGYGANAVLRDIGIVNANVSSAGFDQGGLGTLAGELKGGSIRNVYSTGQVSSTYGPNRGGLVGSLNNATTSYAYSDAQGGLGGLAGAVSGGSISHVHATGDATSGGLFASASNVDVSYTYATGAVFNSSTSMGGQGGLIGQLSINPRQSPSISIKNSFATGDVTGGTYLGGLVGKVTRSGPTRTGTVTIDNVYATGNVTAGYSDTITTGDAVGGLVGAFLLDGYYDDVNIRNAHATGTIKLSQEQGGTGITGGLVGSLSGRLVNIENASYTGNIDAPSGTYIGGLVGSLSASRSATISGVRVSGNINGGNIVGGLIGRSIGEGFEAQGTTIKSSYFDGQVTARQGTAGGLFGFVGDGNIGADVYYNKDGASSAIGSTSPYGKVTDNSQGLTSAEFSDIEHYLDGTINQVLADRAAQAEREQAAREQAERDQAARELAAREQAERDQAAREQAERDQAERNQVLADRVALATSQGGAQRITAQQQNVDYARLAALSQAGQIAQPKDVASHIAFANDSANYSADIQSIEVDGASFKLEQDSSNTRNKKQSAD